jgi:hypothetical protein
MNGCRPDSEITSSASSSVTNEEVQASGSLVDTIVQLPISKHTVAISKKLSPEKVALIDKYFSSGSKKSVLSKITPNALPCGTHTDAFWTPMEEFQAISSKPIGIMLSPDIVSYSKAHNQYGFSKIYANSAATVDSAHSAGFDYDNIMYALGNASQAAAQISESNSGGRHVGAYFIDELLEHNIAWDGYSIGQIAQSFAPKKLFVSSFKWPGWIYSYPQTWGNKYGELLNAGNNIYIMCDQYNGDLEGSATEYWDEFHSYYGSNKSISNWMSVTANNGDGNSHRGYVWPTETASDWSSLFDYTSILPLSEVWLYASNTGNEANVQNFCLVAWEKGWLLQKYQYIIINWRCASTPVCTKCSWDLEKGQWYIDNINYTGEYQYLPYTN